MECQLALIICTYAAELSSTGARMSYICTHPHPGASWMEDVGWIEDEKIDKNNTTCPRSKAARRARILK